MIDTSGTFNANPMNWNKLPMCILCLIFQYLKFHDRRTAAQTCKRWSEVLNYPDLWSSLVCVFKPEDRENPNVPHCQGSHTLRVVDRCAPWVRNLTIEWHTGEEEERSQNIEILDIFLERLVTLRDVLQLKELHLRGKEPENENYEALTLSLARFLRHQKNLKIFEMTWSLEVINTSLILDALTTNCVSSLKVLNIARAITSRRLRIQTAINKYILACNHLYKIGLAYEQIGEGNLLHLAYHFKNTLTTMTLFADVDFLDIKNYQNCTVKSDIWKLVKQFIPKLKVNFKIDSFSNTLDHVENIIVEEVPLYGLYYRGQSLPNCTFRYLKTFSKSLEVLRLHLVSGDLIDSGIVHLLKSCSKLTVLQFKGTCPTIIIEEVIIWIKERKSISSYVPFQAPNLIHNAHLQTRRIGKNTWRLELGGNCHHRVIKELLNLGRYGQSEAKSKWILMGFVIFVLIILGILPSLSIMHKTT